MAIHSTAVIDRRAELDSDVEVGAYAVIDADVRVHKGACIKPKAYLTGWTDIGPRCIIHANACIGGAPQDRQYAGARSFCRIGADTEIREGATVHRGTAEDSTTLVGERCLLMVNSHVGHNCSVGDDAILVNGAGLGGHVTIGPRAFVSGLCGVHQFVRIGELAMIGVLAKVVMDVPPFMTVGGDGARCTGVNLIGMRRAGFSSAEREEIRGAYRLLYRADRLFRSALVELAERVVTQPGRRLVEFLRLPSRRGILHGGRNTARREAGAACDPSPVLQLPPAV